jgi:hypothetical protein
MTGAILFPSAVPPCTKTALECTNTGVPTTGERGVTPAPGLGAGDLDVYRHFMTRFLQSKERI